MQTKKLLLLSVSAGAGHMRAAQALLAQTEASGLAIEATHCDAMDYVTATFRKIYTDFYIQLVDKAPSLWGHLYHRSNEADPKSVVEKMRRTLERMNAGALLRHIRDFAPDAVVCTHFLPAEMLARLLRKNQLTCPVWVQVTDFDLHRMWVHEGMAGYFAANDEVAYRMAAHGISPARIHTTGIPIMPAFGQALSRAACAAQAGLDPSKTTLLLMGGGAGMGSLAAVAQQLMALAGDFQLIVLAGKNKQALEQLQTLSDQFPERLFPQGFTQNVERLMACADLVITKPGGLTTSESLAMGLPMVLNAPIPGQEERNADFLMEQGVALKALDALSLLYRVRHLLDHPATLQAMRDKARALGKPQAAQQVLERVFA